MQPLDYRVELLVGQVRAVGDLRPHARHQLRSIRLSHHLRLGYIRELDAITAVQRDRTTALVDRPAQTVRFEPRPRLRQDRWPSRLNHGILRLHKGASLSNGAHFGVIRDNQAAYQPLSRTAVSVTATRPLAVPPANTGIVALRRRLS